MHIASKSLEKSTQKKLKQAADDLPFATSVALNDVGFSARSDLQAYVNRSFDRPSALTKRAILVDKSTKQYLAAGVFIRERVAGGTAPAEYFRHHIEGGEREFKSMERGLQKETADSRWRSSQLAKNLPDDLFFVPASGLRLNASGNITRGLARRILSETRKPNGKYFLTMSQNKRNVLVLERMARGRVRVALIGVRSPRYSARLDFYGQAQRSVARHYPGAIERALDKVLPKSDR